MVTLKDIEDFLKFKSFAIVGVSREKKKFGNLVYCELKKKGYQLYPVNRFATSIDGDFCYKNISELPPDVRHVLIVVPKSKTNQVMQEVIDKGITHIWLQQQSETEEALQLAKDNNINLIYGQCIFMHAKPVTGFHCFHRFLKKLGGKFPS